jgi:hypothetical protein
MLREFIAPGGKLVFRAGRQKDWDVSQILRGVGVEPDGVITRAHPLTGDLRVTAWLSAR